MADKEVTKKRIAELEAAMAAPDFWSDKDKAQSSIKELQGLKAALEGGESYDAGNAIVTMFSGAGGDDAEDFSGMLFTMYRRFCERKGLGLILLGENQNSHGGYRNVTFEVKGRGAYGILKNESGVHRLVRISPFNAQGKRQTSFSLVEVVPELSKTASIDLPPEDVDIQFQRSGGPGGQNVNKRETAVRAVHTPTGLSVHVTSERSQGQNKEKALEILKGKLYKKELEDKKKEAAGLAISKTVSIEWGSQIRSYVLHPYKLVKDHRTDVETHDPDAVLDGNIDKFIEAERALE